VLWEILLEIGREGLNSAGVAQLKEAKRIIHPMSFS